MTKKESKEYNPEIWLETSDAPNIDNEIKSEVKSIKDILEQIPEEIRKKLVIDEDIDNNEFQINGLETVVLVRNPVSIDIHNVQSINEIQYTIKTKNGGQLVITDSGRTFVTIV